MDEHLRTRDTMKILKVFAIAGCWVLLCAATKGTEVTSAQIAQFQIGVATVLDVEGTSLDRFELVMGIKDEFGVAWTGEEQESIHTVGDIIERVKLHSAG
jgi:acyl carrier protein